MVEITLFGDPVDIPKISYNPHVLNTGIALSKSRQEVSGCDLTLILKDHSIMLLHKSILICHSPVFAAMLTGGNCVESLQGELQIDDFDAKVVPEIVFCYQGISSDLPPPPFGAIFQKTRGRVFLHQPPPQGQPVFLFPFPPHGKNYSQRRELFSL